MCSQGGAIISDFQVQYEAWPLNRDGLVNFTMVLNAVKGLKQHILGD